MKLIEQIKDRTSPLADILAHRMPCATQVASSISSTIEILPTIRPEPGSPHALLAKAVLYRIRFQLASPPSRELPAWLAALRLGLGPTVQDIGPFEAFFDQLDDFLDRTPRLQGTLNTRSESLLCRYALALARIELLGTEQREEGKPPVQIQELMQDLRLNRTLQIPHPDWVRDVTKIVASFQAERDLLLAGPVTLFPRFAGDALAGAEEDDFQSGSRLISLHTTVFPAVTGTQLLRIVTRCLLDREDQSGIRSVGIYLTRQGKMLEWPLKSLVEQLGGQVAPSIPELREELAAVYQDPSSNEKRLTRLFRRRGLRHRTGLKKLAQKSTEAA